MNVNNIINVLNKIGITEKDIVCIKVIDENNIEKANINDNIIKKIDNKIRHCQMIDLVRNTKGIFYSTELEQLCKGGASALGFLETPEKIKNGSFYYNELKHFKDIEAAKKTIDSIYFIKNKNTKIILYYPIYYTETIEPDVILFFVNPKKSMILTQSYLYTHGGSLASEFSGKQSFCSDSVSKVIIENKPNISIGCSGSRKNTSIKDEELIFSIPYNQFNELYDGLTNICT